MPRKTIRPSKTNNLTFHLSFHREDSSQRVLQLERAFELLDAHDQQVIEGCVVALASDPRIKGMGYKAAFELVGALGEWMAWQEKSSEEKRRIT